MNTMPDWELEELAHAEAEHHTLCQLLKSRDLPEATMIATISGYSTVRVDGGGAGDTPQHEVTLWVPAGQFDVVSDEIREALTAGVARVVGPDRFAGLVVRVQVTAGGDGWREALLEELLNLLQQRQSSTSESSLRALTS